MHLDIHDRSGQPQTGSGFSTVIVAIFLAALMVVSILVMVTGYFAARRAVDQGVLQFVDRNEAIAGLVLQSKTVEFNQLLDLTALDEGLRLALLSRDAEVVSAQLSDIYNAQDPGRIDLLFFQSVGSKLVVDVSAQVYQTAPITDAAISKATVEYDNQVFVAGPPDNRVYAIISRRYVIAPQSGKLLGFVYGGVILNDNAILMRDFMRATGASYAAVFHGNRLVASFPPTGWVGFDAKAHPKQGFYDESGDHLIIGSTLSVSSFEGEVFRVFGGFSLGVVESLVHNYRIAILFLCGGILMIAVVSAWYLKRVSGRAIGMLSNYARDVSSGRRDARFAASSIREINEVGRTLEEFVVALKESENQQQNLLDHTTSVVYIKHLDGRFIFVNRMFQELYNAQLEGIQDKTDFDFFPPEIAETLRENDKEALQADGPVEKEETILHRDGEHIYISVKFPLRNAANEVYAVCGISTDITERKAAEERLRTAMIEAKNANRTKSEFLAIMSHEFRTPLNAIIGFSDMMKAEFFGPLGAQKYQDYVKNIHQSGQHMLNLVNELLDIVSIEAGKRSIVKEYMDVAGLIHDCVDNLQPLARENDVRLRLELTADLPDLYADKRSMTQILLNVISNAVKFSKYGGKVDVSVTDLGVDLQVSVSDNGIGIPEELMEVVTEPFSQVDGDPHRTREGTGLGLSIVKALVEKHDGSLELESVEGQGTTVTMTFPWREGAGFQQGMAGG